VIFCGCCLMRTAVVPMMMMFVVTQLFSLTNHPVAVFSSYGYLLRLRR
jgi:hypothetical protein